MTAITDATLVIETLIGRSLIGSQLLNIGNNFVARDPYGLWSPADPQAPTNEEKAQLVLDTLLTFGKQTVRDGAEKTSVDTSRTQIEADIATAMADLE